MLRIAAVFLALSAAAFAQTPTIMAVVNSADFTGALCPGMLAVVYGANFGINNAPVSVMVGGKSAYVYSTVGAATQLTVEIPFELTAGPTTLTVTVGSAASTPFNITLAAYAPSIPTEDTSGTGFGDVYDASNKNTLVTLTNPAQPGDVLTLYCYGLGPTNPATATGNPTVANQTATTPTVTVGGVPAVVSSAGVFPGYPGFYQINFTAPAGLQGTVPLVVGIGGVNSSTGTTLPFAGLSSVVNSGSFAAPGTASPGSIATIFANSLGTTTNQLSGLFPAISSEGVKATFNGIAAPLFNVVASGTASAGSYQQLDFQQQIDVLVPANLPTTGTVNVQLTTATALYPNYTLTMVPANPGFYRVSGNVIAQFNGTAGLALPVATTTAFGLPECTSTTAAAIVCGQPADIGDYLVLYLTGLGLATPGGSPTGTPLATGSVAPADGSVLYETPTTPVVTVGGIPAPVLFSGIVPSTAGEYEIVIQVPSGVTNGNTIPVKVTMLGASDTATISIQPRAGS